MMAMMRASLKNAIRIPWTLTGEDRRTVQTVLTEAGISAVFSDSSTSTCNHQVLAALREVHRQSLLKSIGDIGVQTLFIGAGWIVILKRGE